MLPRNNRYAGLTCFKFRFLQRPQEPLNQLPNFGEFQISMGDGLLPPPPPPPNQPTIGGLEPDLPAISKAKAGDDAVRDRLDADGQQRLID